METAQVVVNLPVPLLPRMNATDGKVSPQRVCREGVLILDMAYEAACLCQPRFEALRWGLLL